MNIILLTVDALRKDSADSMDFVKELKKLGTSFEEHLTAEAIWTLPAVATQLTGRLIKDHQMIITKVGDSAEKESPDALPLSKSIQTFPQVLKECGYRTIAYTAGCFFSKIYDFDRGYTEWYEVGDWDKLKALVEFLDMDIDKSFFHTHNFFVHDWPGDTEKSTVEWIKKFRSGKYTEDDVKFVRKVYEERVRRLDKYMCDSVLDRLKRRFDDLVFIFTADHGEAFLERENDFHHGSGRTERIESVVHIPLIFVGSGIPNRLVKARTWDYDLAPTICGLIGQSFPCEGRDLFRTNLDREVINVSKDSQPEVCVIDDKEKEKIKQQLKDAGYI